MPILLCLLALLWPASAGARITRLVVESRTPESTTAHARIAYEKLQGVAYGEVDPKDRRNAILQDLALAPRNARGKVEYAATFTLYKPIDAAGGSGILLYEVVNRGASILPREFASGDIFLESGWQGDIPFRGLSAYGSPAETIQVPVARNADGSPITGPVMLRFANLASGAVSVSTRQAAGYISSGPAPAPVDLDTAHATLTSRAAESTSGSVSGEQSIPSGDWSWGDCSRTPFPGKPDPASICLKNGFDPARLYQLVYRGKDPRVLGLGLAAVRDLVAFFHHAAQDETGAANPLAGQVRHTIGRGASQSGNLLRTFLNLGFNEDEQGKKVFEGVMPLIAARQTPMNLRFAIPGGASNLYEPGSDGTVWWATWPDPVRHRRPAGLLSRCTANRTCPRIVDVLGSTEFWALRASPDFVGTDNARDIPLPANVRRYYVASTQHGGGGGGFQAGPVTPPPASGAGRNPFNAACTLPLNPNPMQEINRALLAALKDWVVKGTPPPPSVFPTLAAGTLVAETAQAMGYPRVPGLPLPDGMANPLLVYDFGSGFRAADVSGFLAQQPPRVAKVIQPLVPRVDADGNEVGGIHTVLQQAPLGTYLGWNVTAQGFFRGQYCSLSGGYLPFVATRAARLAAGDSRLSLEERYGSHKGYVCAVRRAADRLVHQRFMLPDDASRQIGQAEASNVLAGSGQPTAENERRAAAVCAGQL